MKRITLLTALAGGLLTAAPALACTPVIATDLATGETRTSGSDTWQRHEQAEWRARSSVVLLAQVRAGRVLPDGNIAFSLAPIATVYGGDMPDHDLPLQWTPGNTCNALTLALADTVVVYVGADEAVVGLILPDQLQDRPPEYSLRLREIRRGMIRPRD